MKWQKYLILFLFVIYSYAENQFRDQKCEKVTAAARIFYL